MIRLTGLAAGCTPTAHPTGTRSLPPATTPGYKEPGVERAAVKQGGIVAVDDPYPPGFGSLKESRGFYHHFAFALPFGLASTHAGVWQYRPAVALSGRLTPTRDPAPRPSPSFSGPLHQPRAGIPTGTDEMFDVRHLLSHGASWRRFTFLGFTHMCATNRSGGFKLKRVTSKKKCKRSSNRSRPRCADGCITRSLNRDAGSPASLKGTTTTTQCPTTARPCAASDERVIWHWRAALARRSQKGRITWKRIDRLAARWLPEPRILHPWPNQRFDAKTRGRSPVR